MISRPFPADGDGTMERDTTMGVHVHSHRAAYASRRPVSPLSSCGENTLKRAKGCDSSIDGARNKEDLLLGS